jgi:thioredoxin-like negative regulator of GroEL
MRGGQHRPTKHYHSLLDILEIVNINLLQKLKQKLRQEPILADIWLFYMDHFADHAEFANRSVANCWRRH